MNDLDTLVPQGIELVIDGEPLVIKPLKLDPPKPAGEYILAQLRA